MDKSVAVRKCVFRGDMLLLVAGAFQFSALKYRCLEKCRSPFSFVVEHCQGCRERWQSPRALDWITACTAVGR